MGIRVLYKGAWGFSASSDLSDLAALFDKAFDNARVAAERVTFPVRLAEKDAIQAKFESPCAINPFEVPLADKVAFLKEMDEKLNQEGVFQRVCDMTFMRKQIVFMDSEGSQIEKLITEAFSTMQVSGLDEQGATYERTFRPARRGDSRGWESDRQAALQRKRRKDRQRDEPGPRRRRMPQGRPLGHPFARHHVSADP